MIEQISLNLKFRSIRCIRWMNVIIFEEASPGWFWLRNKNKKRRKGKERKKDNMAGYFESYQRIPL